MMKDKNNHEHQIDKLFAGKLGNLEGTPSANAWQTLEKSLSEKGRKKNRAVIWLPYAAAAAIALIVVSVWLLRQQMPGEVGNSRLADKGKIESRQNPDKLKNNSGNVQDTPQNQEAIIQLPDKKETEGQIAMQGEMAKKEAVEKQIAQPEKATRASIEETNRQIADIKLVTQPVLNKAKREKITKPAISSIENTVAQLEKQPSLVTPSSFTKEETMTIVVTVKLDEEVTGTTEEEMEEDEQVQQTQKQSKAGKFFSTLKKIKKGDFDELGIKPETIVAYVKDRAASNNQSNEK